MSRAVISDTERRAALEPIYDIDQRTGAHIEVFYCDPVLAKSFGRRSGWFWWSCQCGFLPEGEPIGPFATSYRAYRDALDKTRL